MINQHYLKRYNKLISYYQSIIVDGYVEKHHIIPKCMGGTDDRMNLVALPVRVHFICHYLLHKAYPNNSPLALALSMMTVNNPYQKRQSKSYLYEIARTARSNALKGVPRPEWVKEKLRVPKKNKENYLGAKSKEHAAAISKSLKGKKKSKEHIAKSVEGRKSYFESKTKLKNERIKKYRKLFSESNLKRKDFYLLHPELSPSTIKGYLTGL